MSDEIVKSWAVIGDAGIVVNAVVWDGESVWPHDQQLIDLTNWPGVGVGWKWTGSSFVDVRPPVDYDA